MIAFICPLLLLTVTVHEGSTLVRRGNRAGKGGGRQPKTNFLHFLILPKETLDWKVEENIQALGTPFQRGWTHSGWYSSGSPCSLHPVPSKHTLEDVLGCSSPLLSGDDPKAGFTDIMQMKKRTGSVPKPRMRPYS